MATDNRLIVTSLDFDTIKGDLQNFLQAYPQFTDYDFEGSGLSVILDLLAYNSHYSGFYQNMIANEMFLDTATLRSSVVSRAKLLGYTPRSTTSARAIVNITVTPPDTPATIIIQAYTSFGASINGVSYTFLTDETNIMTPSPGNVFNFNNITLVEGKAFTITTTVDSTIPNQRFVIPNALVDTTTISVTVQASAANLYTEVYTLADDVNLITDQSRIFYLQEVENGLFQVEFGDGILGYAPIDGNIVVVNYLLSSGPAANQVTSLTPISLVGGYAKQYVTVTNVTPAYGGADRETIDEIRFTAPRTFEAQGRAVTANDYETLVVANYPVVESIAVWGGEDAIPPQYGKVYISLKPVDGYVITATTKQAVVNNILKPLNMMSVIPEVVDPDYTFIIAQCKVYYNPALTAESAGDIQSLTVQTIAQYGIDNLSRFNYMLKYSALLTSVDNEDPSIVNNLVAIQLQKRFAPSLNVSINYTFNYNGALTPGTFASSWMVIAQDPNIAYKDGDLHRLVDDGNGNINIVKSLPNNLQTVVRANGGTIDYTTGLVILNQLKPTSYNGMSNVTLTVIPKENDVTPSSNNILILNQEDVTVAVYTSTSL